MRFEQMIDRVIEGDCIELIKKIPSKSIDLVITSPPYYKQRDWMGIGNEETPEAYLEKILGVFHECVRVTKDTGSIIFNLGDKYHEGSLLLIPYRFAIEALRREKVKLINTITWVKTNPTPRQFKRRLVQSTEPFFHFVKSDNYKFNLHSFMSEEARIERRRRMKNIGQRYFKLIEEAPLSEYEKEIAREELRKVIEEVKEGKIKEFRMKIRGIHAPAFGGQEGGRKIQMEKQGFTIIRIHGNSMKRDVIECAVETLKGCPHPAVFPEFIVRELIKLTTDEGDIVLDPFMGSGTVAVAAKKLKRKFIGFEINPEYCKYAEGRLKSVENASQKALFEGF